MKTNIKQIVSLSAVLMVALVSAACTPKQRQRQVHEGPKDFSVKIKSQEELSIQNSDFNKIPLEAIENSLTGPVKDLERKVLEPLGRFILDAQYVSTPQHRNKRLERGIAIFNEALFKTLDNAGTLTDNAKAEWLKRFENVVFSSCTADLKHGCVNANIFSGDTYTSQILVFVATQDDDKLNNEIKIQGTTRNCIENSEFCRTLVNLRYRRLAMAFSLKRTRSADQKLSFAFMKYIRALDYFVARGGEVGYLTSTYGSIFETLISRYEPKDVNTMEFRQFIENFNPWTYSSKGSDVFRHGSKAMLDLATQCCMYSEGGHYKLSPSIKQGILESQKDVEVLTAEDEKTMNVNVSFHAMVKILLARSKDQKTGKEKTVDILTNLGLTKDLQRLEDLNSNFYNEYFFIIDRLFKEHLDTSEALRILERTDVNRAKQELLPTVKLYMRVQLAYLTVDTIDFMNKLYNSNISSNLIFSEALNVSRDISIRWMKAQGRLDLLNTFVGSYFKRMTIVPEEFNETADLLRSVNRNIHYLSVYPNMIGMTYFLTKNQGVVKARSWWGKDFEIKPETIVADLFDGTGESVKDVWFRFSTTPVTLSRERLFYAFHYALKTQAFETFTVDEKSEGQSDRAKFFELTLGKYLENTKRDLENTYSELERVITKTGTFESIDQICKYELDRSGKVAQPAAINISLLNLGKQTYTGFEEGTHFGLIKKMFTLKTEGAIRNIYQNVEPKLTFIRAIIALLENHMLATGEMKPDEKKTNKELANVNKIVTDIETRQRQYLTTFLKMRKNMYACAKQMYKVEMMRSYRLEDEERTYLSKIHAQLKSVHQLAVGEPQSKELEKINLKDFSAGKIKFDRLLSDGYRMSRYDFLIRIKERIEQDIFVQPTERERKVYGSELANLIKRRAVTVEMPLGLERLDIYTSETPTVIAYTENKEEFVNQGMKLLNGQSNAYAAWQLLGDQLDVFVSYLNTLIDLYLMGEISVNSSESATCDSTGCKEKIAPTEILETFKEIVELVNLNEFDIENATVMGLDGRFTTKSLEDFIIEPTSLKAQPLLRSLMRKVYDRTGVKSDASGLLQSGRTLADMLTDEKVVIFEPGPEFNKSLATAYGTPILRILNRAKELFDLMPELEKKPDWQRLYYTKLRLDENSQVIDIVGSRGRESLSVVDSVILNDLSVGRLTYTIKTDNLFGTKINTSGGH